MVRCVLVALALALVVVGVSGSLPVPPGNPLAHAQAQVITSSQVRFTVLTESLVRMEYIPSTSSSSPSPFEDRQTLVVWNRFLPVPQFTTTKKGAVTTISTSSFVLKYTEGIAPGFTRDNLEVTLLSPRYWSNTTKWHPGDKPHGNLKGTFHTLDGLEGWQDMNCTVDNTVWNGAGFGSQPLAHCAWGLVSKDGWSLVDDSRSPIFDGAWPAPQLNGVCDASTPASSRTPCFQDPAYNPDSESDACQAAGCCFDSNTSPQILPLNFFFSSSRNDSYNDVQCQGCTGYNYNFLGFQGWVFQQAQEGMIPLHLYWNPRPPGGDNALVTDAPTMPGYNFVRSVGWIWSPQGKQPQNTSALQLWYSSSMSDYFTTATPTDEERALHMGYKLISLLGYIGIATRNSSTPVPIPPWTPACYQRSGNVDWYLFTHGMNYAGALSDFALIAGAIPIPRRHWLGVSWSRWGNEWTQELTYQQVANLTNDGFPLSTYVFDMNWHLKPDWTGWTWDTKEYPDPPQLLDWLHARGLPIGANLHDAQGVMPFEQRYPDMAAANGIDPASNQTVMFRISDQRYADTLNDLVLEPLAEEGFDFWWTDWQQGEALGVQDCTGLNPTYMLNHYRFMNYSGATRGLLHSRWGGLGNHRYVSGFGGDVIQSWDSLEFMIYFTATATNVLFGYWGHEMMALQSAPINDANLELFTRVMQFGAFSPIYTNWGNGGSDDNLWGFPPVYRDSVQRALAFRLQLLPYLYTLARNAYQTALSPLRPMYYAYPTLAEAYDAQLQYMMGDSLLVAPVVTPADNATGLAKVTVWCPPLSDPDALWYALDNATQTLPADKATRTVAYPLNRVPVFVQDGTVLPVLPYQQAIALGIAVQQSYTQLEWWIYPSSSSATSTTSSMYEDDGMSSDYLTTTNFAITTAIVARKPNAYYITISTTGTYPSFTKQRAYTVRALAFTSSISSLTVDANNQPLKNAPTCSPTTQPPQGTWCAYLEGPSRYTIVASLFVTDTSSPVTVAISAW